MAMTSRVKIWHFGYSKTSGKLKFILNFKKLARLADNYKQLKQCFLRKNYVPLPHLPLSATLKIMVLSYGDHLSNNILWAEMVIGRNGYGPKWSWTQMVMGRNDPEPLYNMSHDVRKQTLCICENKDAKQISVFVFR